MLRVLFYSKMAPGVQSLIAAWPFSFLFSLTSVTSAGCFGDYFFVDFSVLCVLKYLYFWQLPGGEALDKRIFPFERRVGLLLGGGSRHDTRQLDGCPQFEPSLATFGPVRNRALWFTS